jgi:type I protein arginine methyltransferase
MYSIRGYGAMIADSLRTDAYREALRQAVKPGTVVLDIGTGTGIFALLACRFGARKVYAIEPSDAIEVAREIAAANGCRDRIEFIQELSRKVDLPERADVIVSDIRGVLPFFDHHLPSIIDARERMLIDGGALIPKCDSLWAAVAEAPELYKTYAVPWEGNSYQIDMNAARPIATNTWGTGRVKPEQLLTESKCWAMLDYLTIREPNYRGEVTWNAARSGTAHGLSVWFDAILANGVGFSNAPNAPELIYGSAFFPWSEPVTLAVGDTISVTIQANLVGEDYVWRWDTRVLEEENSNKTKADFKQSTFFGVPLSSERLHKRASYHVPALNEAGQIERFVLSLMDGENSLEQIAKRVAAQFPDCFVNDNGSLAYVGDLAEKYSR